MVISSAKQLPDTYQLWRRFSFPTERGPKDAIAVPAVVGNQFTSAYSIMLTIMMVQFLSIVFGLVVYLIVKRGEHRPHPHPLAPILWNKKANPIDSIIEVFSYITKADENTGETAKATGTPPLANRGTSKPPRGEKPWWFFLLLFPIPLAWVGQTIIGVVIPPLLILGNAAPVDPNAIYVPTGYTESDSNSTIAARVTLEIPWALRALGSVDLSNKELRGKVNVSPALPQGKWNNGESILRVNYAYQVAGTDLGLQRYSDLLLSVTGSCVTEYGWFNGTRITTSGSVLVAVDYYQVFDDPSSLESVSLFQASGPVATFYNGRHVKGTVEDSNATWAALVSSVNRTSFSPGSDPWYLTNSGGSGAGNTGASYTVKPARPALSCWQDDVWSYNGRNSTAVELTNKALPGLKLSEGLQIVLARYLDSPMIQQISFRLGPSALKSATTAVGQIFDAQASSFRDDLERLVLAAYIATSNILTDSTLYPTEADRVLTNLAKDENGQIKDGVADFVVWSSDVSALSLAIIIAIPTVMVSVWLCAILFKSLGVKIINALDSVCMFQVLQKEHPYATLGAGGKTWNLQGLDKEQVQDDKLAGPTTSTGNQGNQDEKEDPVISIASHSKQIDEA